MNTNRFSAAGVLLVTALAAGCGGPPTAAPAEPKAAGPTVTRIAVDHVRVTTDKPYDRVTAAFVAGLGKFDAGAAKDALAGGDMAVARTKLEGMAGPSGFMLFGTQDHGTLLRVAGQNRKAMQYVVGNPLFAVEMTRHAIGASLYAPLHVLIYETDDGKTGIEYDKPSSLFGQFGNAQVDQMATSLDMKLEALVAAATR